ncbi:phosphotransferase enzyme family protein [Desulfomarina sp.]
MNGVEKNPELMQAVEQFCPQYPHCSIEIIRKGNINTTCLVQSGSRKIILQRISASVFPEPRHVIENFFSLIAHLEKKCRNIDRKWLFARPVLTTGGDKFFRDGIGGFWRAQTYLDHQPLMLPLSASRAEQIGDALAFFHGLVADLTLSELHDPLPGFHNLSHYLNQFNALRAKEQAMNEDWLYCFHAVERYRSRATFFDRAKEKGILKDQAVHGDPKIDNFIFHTDSAGSGLIDLDTVAAGLVQFDLGDCLRSCCNSTGEDHSGKTAVRFDMDICRGILTGYLKSVYSRLSPVERGYIYDAVLLLTFELGLRFFTDHLAGDTYFKVDQPGENLQRAVVQFRLAEEIENHEKEIREAAEG